VIRTSAEEPWRVPILGPCACSQLRRTARAVSVFYDRFLAPAGLTVTQYALLASIARTEGISRSALALNLGMERTTLTRNLRPLERAKLLKTSAGEDRRERLLKLTPAGYRKLDLSFPLWAEAQKHFLAQVGADQVKGMHSALAAVAGSLDR
jgi:DNA-binding MarR family transcriptional regulator